MEYKFNDFDWLKDRSGFNLPTDVYHGTILLGVIISKPDGYVIDRVMKLHGGSYPIKHSPKNKFKTKELAARALHRTWKFLRKEES